MPCWMSQCKLFSNLQNLTDYAKYFLFLTASFTMATPATHFPPPFPQPKPPSRIDLDNIIIESLYDRRQRATTNEETKRVNREEKELANLLIGTFSACGCVPVEMSDKEYVKQVSWPVEKLRIGAVACDSNGTPMGIVQLALAGHPNELRPVKDGQCYVYYLVVKEEYRGRGVGTKLLQWSKETALEHGASFLTLDMVRGNPAHTLYKRFGFEIEEPPNKVSDLFNTFLVILFLGRPYGCFHKEWGMDYFKMKLK